MENLIFNPDFYKLGRKKKYFKTEKWITFFSSVQKNCRSHSMASYSSVTTFFWVSSQLGQLFKVWMFKYVNTYNVLSTEFNKEWILSASLGIKSTDLGG